MYAAKLDITTELAEKHILKQSKEYPFLKNNLTYERCHRIGHIRIPRFRTANSEN